MKHFTFANEKATQDLGERLLGYDIEQLVDISTDLVFNFESSDLQ